MATSRVTFGSILGSINAAATTVQTSFDAANKGVGMLTRLVTDASEKQNARSKYDMANFYNSLHEEKVKERASNRAELLKWMEEGNNKALYQEADQELSALKASLQKI